MNILASGRTACRICGNEGINAHYSVREMMFGIREEFDYFQCSHCDCLQIDKPPVNMSIYYPARYYSYAQRNEGSVMFRLMSDIRNNFAISNKGTIGRFLYKLRPKSELHALHRVHLSVDSRILDVGCGSGTLLRSLKRLGFRTLMGVDPFLPEDITYHDGVHVKRGNLTDLDGNWDVIMFHHSFEHMYEQFQILRHARKIMSDNGVCIIRVPSVSSHAWRHYGVNWCQLDAPRHFFLHSLRSMEILSNRAGFYIEQVACDSEDFQFWGSELYMADISLIDPRTDRPKVKEDLFPKEKLSEYALRATQLNSLMDGDQAVFYLKKHCARGHGRDRNSDGL